MFMLCQKTFDIQDVTWHYGYIGTIFDANDMVDKRSRQPNVFPTGAFKLPGQTQGVAYISPNMPPSPFTQKIIDLVLAIPPGRVATYGSIAAMAGNRRAARQVARILHTCSRTKGMPWHRVINREGRISLPEHNGYDRQKSLLTKEGVEFDNTDRIDLDRFLWIP